MIRLNEDRIKAIYSLLVKETGGSSGLRDAGLLVSSLESIFQTFGGDELYPTIEEKGAWLAFSLIANHVFVDGNKRIGMLSMLTFLEVNGIMIECTDDDIIAAGLGTASGRMGYDSLLEWIHQHEIGYKPSF